MSTCNRSAAWVLLAVTLNYGLTMCASVPLHPGNPHIVPLWAAICAAVALVAQFPLLMVRSHLRYERGQQEGRRS